MGAVDMTMALPKQSLTTQRWEEQVEKAFLGPSPDWILRMASGCTWRTPAPGTGPQKNKHRKLVNSP